MDDDPKPAMAAAAEALLARLAPAAVTEPQRVTAAGGRLVCMILLWDAAGPMPTADGDRRRRSRRGREQCRQDVLAVLRAAGRPLTKKRLITAVIAAGYDHGPGTVAKALADLTDSKALVNPRDRLGYRLAEWVRPRLGLFDAG